MSKHSELAAMKKKMLTPKQHQSLKTRLKKAYQAYKKVESDLKLSGKKLDLAEKALKKATKEASVKKTPQAKKAKLRASQNFKNAKAKLTQLEKRSIDKSCDVIDAEYLLDAAKRKQAAWEKDLVAFEKKWEREYGKKPKAKSAAAKKPAKKVVAKKLKPADVEKTEAKVANPFSLFSKAPEKKETVHAVEPKLVEPESKDISAPAEEPKPINPFPFPSGFGFKDDSTH